jgi:hypothetical protein
MIEPARAGFAFCCPRVYSPGISTAGLCHICPPAQAAGYLYQANSKLAVFPAKISLLEQALLARYAAPVAREFTRRAIHPPITRN